MIEEVTEIPEIIAEVIPEIKVKKTRKRKVKEIITSFNPFTLNIDESSIFHLFRNNRKVVHIDHTLKLKEDSLYFPINLMRSFIFHTTDTINLNYVGEKSTAKKLIDSNKYSEIALLSELGDDYHNCKIALYDICDKENINNIKVEPIKSSIETFIRTCLTLNNIIKYTPIIKGNYFSKESIKNVTKYVCSFLPLNRFMIMKKIEGCNSYFRYLGGSYSLYRAEYFSCLGEASLGYNNHETGVKPFKIIPLFCLVGKKEFREEIATCSLMGKEIPSSYLTFMVSKNYLDSKDPTLTTLYKKVLKQIILVNIEIVIINDSVKDELFYGETISSSFDLLNQLYSLNLPPKFLTLSSKNQWVEKTIKERFNEFKKMLEPLEVVNDTVEMPF